MEHNVVVLLRGGVGVGKEKAPSLLLGQTEVSPKVVPKYTHFAS